MAGFGDDLTPGPMPPSAVQKFFMAYNDKLTVVKALEGAPFTIKSMDNGFALTAEIAIWVTPSELAELLKETE